MPASIGYASNDSPAIMPRPLRVLWWRGELHLRRGDESNATADYREAISVARRMGSKAFELRATTSLARLLDKQGHPDEARAMLADIYNWFTEGFRHRRFERRKGPARRAGCVAMNCTKCGTDNREGRKFCAKCAAPLARVCPQCGASNEPGENFCGECAAALGQTPTASAKKPNDPPIRVAEKPAPENLEGERKTVTALFADIKGSTELEQDLDPEEARAIIDPALKLMIDAVRRYDGYIVQSTGDGIFALFGAPLAHEDHPQRALYSALRMQEELKRYSAKVVADGGMPIEARIGANTGEVVVRSISTGSGHVEFTPIGHTTNLASRMQAVAPTGSIAISENTRKLVEGYFALQPLGPTKVKGVSEPVNVYEVTGLGPLRTRLQRSAGRGSTAMSF